MTRLPIQLAWVRKSLNGYAGWNVIIAEALIRWVNPIVLHAAHRLELNNPVRAKLVDMYSNLVNIIVQIAALQPTNRINGLQLARASDGRLN